MTLIGPHEEPPKKQAKREQQPSTRREGALGPRGYAQLATHIVSGVTVIAYLQQLRDYDLANLVMMGVGLLVTVGAHARLCTGNGSGRSRAMWALFLVSGLALGGWAAVPSREVQESANGETPSGPSDDPDREKLYRRRRQDKANGITVGPPVYVGSRAMAMTTGGDGLWMAASSGFGHYDPDRSARPPNVLGSEGRAYDIATTKDLVVSVRGPGATAYFTEKDSGDPARPEFRFGEVPGHVDVGFETAWFCNVSQSKIDWVNLETGAIGSIDVPGVPKAILVTAEAVFVATSDEYGPEPEERYVVRINPVTLKEEARVRISDDPTALAFGFGDIWVGFGEVGIVNRIANPYGLMRVRELDIDVTTDIQALAVGADSVFALGRATKKLDRIDPERNKVITSEELRLTPGDKKRPGVPGDLVAYEHVLWVTDIYWGTLSAITVRPRNALRSEGVVGPPPAGSESQAMGSLPRKRLDVAAQPRRRGYRAPRPDSLAASSRKAERRTVSVSSPLPPHTGNGRVRLPRPRPAGIAPSRPHLSQRAARVVEPLGVATSDEGRRRIGRALPDSGVPASPSPVAPEPALPVSVPAAG